MTKDAYYFPHDSNAFSDPKILQMRSVYGLEGYGLYWAIIERMREQSDYKLPIKGKYAIEAYAKAMGVTKEKLEGFINDCVNEFKDGEEPLFYRDDGHIWSTSLIRRMSVFTAKSEQARRAASARWGNADAMPPQSDSNADAMPPLSDSNASKVEYSKVEYSKDSRVEGDGAANVFKTYQDNIGVLTPKIAEELKDIVKTYPPEWFDEAVKEACNYNRRNLSYINRILQRWQTEGFKSKYSQPPKVQNESGRKYRRVN